MREEKTVKPSQSFRIKDALTQTAQSTKDKNINQEEQKIEVEGKDPFDIPKIQEAFTEYIRINNLDTTTSMALKSHTPKLTGEQISIEVDNPLQQEKLESLLGNLRNFMVKFLNNGSISCSVRLFENQDGTEEKKLVTSQAKFEHFVELNPVIQEMKKMFGLEIE